MFDSKTIVTEIALVVSGCLAITGVLLSHWHWKIFVHSLSVLALLFGLYWQDVTFFWEFLFVPLVILGFYGSIWKWQPKGRQWQKMLLFTGLVVCVMAGVFWQAWSSMDYYHGFLTELSPVQFFGQDGISEESLWLLTAFNLLAGFFWLVKERAIRDR